MKQSYSFVSVIIFEHHNHQRVYDWVVDYELRPMFALRDATNQQLKIS